MGVLSNPTGHLLVSYAVAGAGDNRVKVTDHLPAQVADGDSGARLAVLEAEGAKDLQSVEKGIVANLMDCAPEDFATARNGSRRAFTTVAQVSAFDYSRVGREGQISVTAADAVHTLDFSSFQIGSNQSDLSDAFVRCDGKLLGGCADDEAVYQPLTRANAPGPRCKVLPINQIGASLERLGKRDRRGIKIPPTEFCNRAGTGRPCSSTRQSAADVSG